MPSARRRRNPPGPSCPRKRPGEPSRSASAPETRRSTKDTKIHEGHRFVVLGAGAVGGVVGGRLAQHGHSVILIARGRHYEAIRDKGLRLESPDGVSVVDLPVVDHPSLIGWTPGTVVLLTTKTQDTASALDALASVAPPTTPIFCVQNGVANERMALRLFADVYGVYVWCPTGYTTPGVVQAWCAPTPGILDVGRYPSGTHPLAESVAAAFRASSFVAEVRGDIMRWKYRKLLSNVGNAVEALCGPAARGAGIASEARREAVACLEAAGIAFVADDDEADPVRRERQVASRPISGVERPGGSSWQSLERHAGSIETDFLNGEIVLIGRLHGVPTPVNALLQRLSRQMARENSPPGSMSPEDLSQMIREIH